MQYRGRGVVAAWFSRFEPTPKRHEVIVEGGTAAVEMDLRELLSGFASATAAIYEVRGGEIVVVRLYCALPDLVDRNGPTRSPLT